MRIIFMVPVYAVSSFCSLIFPHGAIYFDTVRIWCALVSLLHKHIIPSEAPRQLRAVAGHDYLPSSCSWTPG